MALCEDMQNNTILDSNDVVEPTMETTVEIRMEKPKVHPDVLNAAVREFVDLLIDEEIFYIGREVGRQLRWGELEALGVLDDVTPEFQIVDAPGVDIFGQPLAKKYNFECECPKCNRTLAAVRFAPHLEKCMGMGRNSSRIASRRLAAASNSNSNSSFDGNKNSGQNASSSSQLNGDLGSEEETFEDDEDDEEWTMERKKKTKKSEKAAPKKKSAVQRLKAEAAVRAKRGVSPSVSELPTFSLIDMPIIMEGDDVSSSQ